VNEQKNDNYYTEKKCGPPLEPYKHSGSEESAYSSQKTTPEEGFPIKGIPLNPPPQKALKRLVCEKNENEGGNQDQIWP
jgi:hypothetical protein